MAFNQSEAYKHALCMELQNDEFRFLIIDINTKKSVMEKSFTLLLFNKVELNTILEDEIFKLDFKSISLSIASNRHTLVPFSIFNNSKPKDVFALNHQAPYDNIDYNRIAELGIVTLFELPIWIKSVFVLKTPRIKLVHTSTVLLKGIFKTAIHKPKVHIHWQSDSFYLVISSKGKLQYFNLFQGNDINDLVYHLLFVLEQKELNIKDMGVHFYGVSSDWKELEKISKFLNHKIEVASEKEKAKDFILTNQLLCV